MGKTRIKLNESNLINKDYQKKCTLKCVVEGTTDEELAELEREFMAVRGIRWVGQPKPAEETEATIQRVESKPRPKPDPDKPKPVRRQRTEEEKKATAEKKAYNAAIKKAEKQQYCVLDHGDLESMPIEEITAELVEFYMADPENPVRMDLILTMLGDLGVMNAIGCLKFDKHIPAEVLEPIIRAIFLPKKWTDMMLTCLNHFKEFFDGKEWQKLKSSFYKAVYRLYVRISPAEAVAKVAGLTKLPRKVEDKFRPVWDFLWKVPLSIYC